MGGSTCSLNQDCIHLLLPPQQFLQHSDQVASHFAADAPIIELQGQHKSTHDPSMDVLSIILHSGCRQDLSLSAFPATQATDRTGLPKLGWGMENFSVFELASKISSLLPSFCFTKD